LLEQVAIFLTWPALVSLGLRDSHLAFLWSDALGMQHMCASSQTGGEGFTTHDWSSGMASSCIVGTHIGYERTGKAPLTPRTSAAPRPHLGCTATRREKSSTASPLHRALHASP